MAQQGDAYWRTRSESLLRQMAVEVKYGTEHDDPDFPEWVGATEQDYREVGQQMGWREFYNALQFKRTMEDLYFDDDEGDRIEAARLYDQLRDGYPNVPYWFWGYHGVYA